MGATETLIQNGVNDTQGALFEMLRRFRRYFEKTLEAERERELRAAIEEAERALGHLRVVAPLVERAARRKRQKARGETDAGSRAGPDT